MWVADRTAPSTASLIEFVLKLYQCASFQVMEVSTNHEFKPMFHVLQHDGWSFMTNLANAQENVLEAEHKKCILKEHVRPIYHGIPYKMSHEPLFATW